MRTQFISFQSFPLTLLVVNLAIFAGMFLPQGISAQIVWHPDVATATKAAAENNKLVMMHFTASWCRPCRTLDTFVFTNRGVQRVFEDNVAAVKIDVDKQPELAREYGVLSVPSDVAMTPAGRVVSKRKSPKDPSAYVRMVSGYSKILSEGTEGEKAAVVQNLAELQELMASKQPKFEGQPTSFTPDAPSYKAPAPSYHAGELQRKSRFVTNPFAPKAAPVQPKPQHVANAFAPASAQQAQPNFNGQAQNQFQPPAQNQEQAFLVEPQIQGRAVSLPAASAVSSGSTAADFAPPSQDRSQLVQQPAGQLMAPPQMQPVQVPSNASGGNQFQVDPNGGLDQAAVEQMFASQRQAADSLNSIQSKVAVPTPNRVASAPTISMPRAQDSVTQHFLPPSRHQSFQGPAIQNPSIQSPVQQGQLNNQISPNQINANQINANPINANQINSNLSEPNQTQPPSGQLNAPPLAKPTPQWEQPVVVSPRPPVEIKVADVVQGEFQFENEPQPMNVTPVSPNANQMSTGFAPGNVVPDSRGVAPMAPGSTAQSAPNVAPSVPPRNIALQRLEQSDVAARLIREKAQKKINAFKAEAKIVTDDKFYGSPRAEQADGTVGNYQAKINFPSSKNSHPGAENVASENSEFDAKAQIVMDDDRKFSRQQTKATSASSKKNLRQPSGTMGEGNFAGHSSAGLQHAAKKPTKPEFALHGKCPVTLLTESKWAAGNEKWGCIHRNRIYIFASQEKLQQFQSDPDAYSPILAGYDPVVFHETGELVDGLEEHGVFMGKAPHQRIVLFANAKTRAQFQQQPRKYLDVVRQAMSNSGGSSSTLIR
ncbi:MAG: thioredoxin family protein [Mariniblastus sp.]